MSTKKQQINEIILGLGGCSCVARKLGISRQAVFRWKNTGTVPPKQVMALCHLSGNLPSEIRPDVFYENEFLAEG